MKQMTRRERIVWAFIGIDVVLAIGAISLWIVFTRFAHLMH